ncbi:hypothetical protein [Agrobacterium tumefaciens]
MDHLARNLDDLRRLVQKNDQARRAYRVLEGRAGIHGR